ncbi:MAG: hypothetical protein KJ011_17020 [Burkholderiaceae bacterium]|nr:hypothetical protein [Burkholderiaceae bacterium]
MKAISSILVSASLAFGAIGAAGAQTQIVEIDYPGPVAPSPAPAARPAQPEPYLIQSNQGAVQVNPAYERATLSREAVRSEARLAMPFGPGLNA